uniref:Uncharacterized protein n=1 Tax=Alexandrium monilatum TaxID=311494 RepID=A0A7S4QX83_9DINO
MVSAPQICKARRSHHPRSVLRWNSGRRRPLITLATASMLAVLLSSVVGLTSVGFVAGAPRSSGPPRTAVTRAAAPALAPAPVRAQPHPGLPARIDETRYGERVRWLMGEEEVSTKPPEWNVLLLDKTFRSPANTVVRVASCLVSVLGLAAGLAKLKAQHAKDNYFSVVHSSTEWVEAIRRAQALQSWGLAVRVTPGARLPAEEDGGEDVADSRTSVWGSRRGRI